MTNSPHRCAAGRSCRSSEIADGKRVPCTIEEEYGLCKRCVHAVTIACRNLARDYAVLTGMSSERIVKGELVVNMTPDPAIPLNVNVLALRSALSEWAEAAVGMVSESLNIEPVQRQRARGFPVKEYPVIEQAVRVLPDNVNLLLEAETQPVMVWASNGKSELVDMDGIAVALKLVSLHRQVRGIAGDTNPRRRLTMPCPVYDCGMPTLGINNGETDVTCTSCGGRWTEAEYDWLAGMVIGEANPKEVKVLKWLLAERDWQLKQLKQQVIEQHEVLTQVKRLASLTPEQVKDIDASAVIELLREQLAALEDS